MSTLVIRHLSENVVDVFVDKGWSNWTRFEVKRVKGKPYPNKIAGKPMTREQFQQLITELQ